jgi:hypothetical protein
MLRATGKLKREIADAHASVRTALKRVNKMAITFRRRRGRCSKYVNIFAYIAELLRLRRDDSPKPMEFLL